MKKLKLTFIIEHEDGKRVLEKTLPQSEMVTPELVAGMARWALMELSYDHEVAASLVFVDEEDRKSLDIEKGTLFPMDTLERIY